MKKLLLKTLLASTLAIMPASAVAITADQLDGKLVGQIFGGDACQLFLPTGAHCGKFVKISDSQVRLKDFLLDGMDITFNILSNGQLSLPYQQKAYPPSLNGKYVCFMTKNYLSTTYRGDEYATYTRREENWISNNITSIGEGSYRINFTMPLAMTVNSMTSDYTNTDYYGIISLFVFPGNTAATSITASGTTYNYDMRAVRRDNTLYMYNWSNYGYAFDSSDYASDYVQRGYVKADIKEASRTLTIAPQQISAYVDAYYDAGYATINNMYSFWYLPEYYWTQPWMTCSTAGTSYRNTTINGSFDYVAPRHNDDTVEISWVSNDGERKTYTDMDVTFLNHGVAQQTQYDSDLNYIDKGSSYSGSTVLKQDIAKTTFSVPVEITHQAEIHDIEFDTNGNGDVTMRCNIQPLQNMQFIKSYDLYCVRKIFTDNSIKDEEFVYDAEHGVQNAILLGNFPVSENALEYYDAHGTFEPIPVNLHKDAVKELADTKEVSFFLKANYIPGIAAAQAAGSARAAGNLGHSFHGLTSDGVITGIEDLVSAPEVTITAGNGEITVTGTEGDIEVYTTSGVCAYEGPAGTIALGSGIYVVRAGTSVTKVNVR